MVKRITKRLISNKTITVAGGSTFTSEPLDLGKYISFGIMIENVVGTNPNFSLQYEVCSTVDGVYFPPNNNALVDANITGSVADMITPVPAPYYKIQAINNTSNEVSFDMNLILQED